MTEKYKIQLKDFLEIEVTDGEGQTILHKKVNEMCSKSEVDRLVNRSIKYAGRRAVTVKILNKSNNRIKVYSLTVT